MGCDKVIYLTRRGDESRFAVGVSSLLGMEDQDYAALYDLASSNSGFSRSLEEADGVMCTAWDEQPRLDLDAFFDDAYNAPFQTTDQELFLNFHPDSIAHLGIKGCSAGVH